MVRRYRSRGLEAMQRRLQEGLTAAGVTGASVLEIVCGAGELQHRVLAAGAVSGRDRRGRRRDRAGRAAAVQAGLERPTTFLVGDAMERAGELPPTALVMLDKVLCCYPEIDTSMQVSPERAQRLYAAVVPRPHWLVAAVWRLAIAVFKLLRSNFTPPITTGSAPRRRTPASASAASSPPTPWPGRSGSSAAQFILVGAMAN